MKKIKAYIILLAILICLCLCGFSFNEKTNAENYQKRVFIGYIIDISKETYGHPSTVIVESEDKNREVFAFPGIYDCMKNHNISDKCKSVVGDKVQVIYYSYDNIIDFEILEMV